MPLTRAPAAARRANLAHELYGDEHEQRRERVAQRAPAERIGERDATRRAGDRQQAEQQRIAAIDVSEAVLCVRTDDRHGDDREQRCRLRLVRAEAEKGDEARHEQDPAADAEQSSDDAAREADDQRADHRSTRSTAVARSTTANSSEI